MVFGWGKRKSQACSLNCGQLISSNSGWKTNMASVVIDLKPKISHLCDMRTVDELSKVVDRNFVKPWLLYGEYFYKLVESA